MLGEKKIKRCFAAPNICIKFLYVGLNLRQDIFSAIHDGVLIKILSDG
jgi:hypothetical protein